MLVDEIYHTIRAWEETNGWYSCIDGNYEGAGWDGGNEKGSFYDEQEAIEWQENTAEKFLKETIEYINNANKLSGSLNLLTSAGFLKR